MIREKTADDQQPAARLQPIVRFVLMMTLMCMVGCGQREQEERKTLPVRGECVFVYEEKVEVNKGFYRGRRGKCEHIIDVNPWKYVVQFEDGGSCVFEEHELRAIK